jgi:hypothetical protein
MACLRETAKNLACGVGQNLDCDGIKAVVGGFGIAITVLSHLYSVLSCQPASLEAPLALCAYRAYNQVSGILIGLHPVKVRLSRHLWPECLVDLAVYEC